ncbi:response regulator [Massilia sp. TWR1-2-2]|uniref:response regulator n=1 Tax=Massilia sp. TWR1-2-2 TaxID=2804584 RepID=UPI003CE8B8EB
MTLHRQTNWFILAASVAIALCLAFTLYASALARDAAAQAGKAEVVARATAQFRYLAMETALYQEDRSEAQWRARIGSFRTALAALDQDSAPARALLARQYSNLEVIQRLYARLARPGIAPLVSGGAASAQHAPAIMNALFLVTQEMADDAFALTRLSREELGSSQQLLSTLMLLNVVMLGSLIALGSLAIRRRVLRPIEILKDVMEAVSSGDLAARVRLPLADELGFLASTFNGMTDQLVRTQALMREEIVQRELAQQALQASMADLARARADVQTVIDHTPALVVYWDAELVNRFTNRASYDWLGLAPEQVQGMRMVDLVGRRRFALHEPRVRAVMRGETALFESLVDLHDGQQRQALFSYIPDIADGVVKGFYGFVSDVTALREAEAGQAAALAQLRGVVDAARDFAIILTDTAGTIALFSPGAERMLGYRADELVGASTPELLHDRAELLARVDSLGDSLGPLPSLYSAVFAPVMGGGSESREWTYRRNDGSALTVSLTMSAVRDDAGAVIGYLGMAKDIGIDKARQRELIAARDAAQAASQTKSQFLANMSHEIRTPMNAVIGMLQLLEYTELTAIQRDYTSKTLGAARSLLALLNDILDLSRIEAAGLQLEEHNFDLAALTAELSSMLGALVGDKHLELILSVDPALPRHLYGDAMRLRQVLINLAGNAIKFTTRGEVRLSIGHSDDGLIVFAVSDTGIGIAADKLETIFDQFSQAEESTTRRFGGTGLGLAISQRLVRLMGGEIDVASRPGHGSRFSFALALPATAPGDVSAPRGMLPIARAGNTLRVLIVDDNGAAREVLSGMVEALGWRADCAADGPQALAMLAQAARYDVILVDWRMPGMDGWELTGRIARQCGADELPVVIMVTASGRAELSERMQQASILPHGFLVKPVTAPMLIDAIQEATGPRAAPAAPAGSGTPATPLAGLRLLLVDDNPLNQQVARELLAKRGALVTVANGGAAAVQLALATLAPFDAVLMDIQMPDMDGYEATRAIRADPRGRQLPILAMTANAMQGDRELSLAAGMNDHLSKPIDLDRVVAALLQHCRAAPEQPPAAPAGPPRLPRPKDSAIDFDLAVRRLGGDTSIYFSLSGIFAAESDALIEELACCFAGRAWKQAADRLHSYKTAAGMIGADDLHHFAGTLEQQLRTSPEQVDCAGTLTTIGTAVAAIQTELRLIEQANRPAPAAPAPSRSIAGLAACLDELDPLLDQASMRALTVFGTLQADYGAHLGDRLDRLAGAMAALDFRAARTHSNYLREGST